MSSQSSLRCEFYKISFIHQVRIMFEVFYNLRIFDKFNSSRIFDLLYIVENVDLTNEEKYNHSLIKSFADFLQINNYQIKSGQRYLENMWTTLNKTPRDELHNTLEMFINKLNANEKRVLNVFMRKPVTGKFQSVEHIRNE